MKPLGKYTLEEANYICKHHNCEKCPLKSHDESGCRIFDAVGTRPDTWAQLDKTPYPVLTASEQELFATLASVLKFDVLQRRINGRLFLLDIARGRWVELEESAFPSILPGQEVPRP